MYGYEPDDAIIEIAPKPGKHTIDDEDIIKAIEEAGDSLAVVMFGGVNYYTGQVFNFKKITEFAHKKNIVVGFEFIKL